MALSKEQSIEIKKQILKQLEKQPVKNKEEIKEYIKTLNEEQLEEFLKQNKIQLSESQGMESGIEPKEQKPVFVSIIAGEIPSHKIAENPKAIAILEINPLSKGHCLILPKKQTAVEKLPKSALSLAQKIAKKIKTKLKPENIKIETSSFQDYPFINVIPIYKDIPLKKEKAEESELKKMQLKLGTKKRAQRKKENSETIKEILSKLPEISFRIP